VQPVKRQEDNDQNAECPWQLSQSDEVSAPASHRNIGTPDRANNVQLLHIERQRRAWRRDRPSRAEICEPI